MAVEETNYNSSSAASEEQYHDRIMRLQQEYLMPLKEDLSDWLNRILDVDDITAENFMSKLDNGVIVCKLAKLIQERCEATQQAFNGKLRAALEEVSKLYALFNSLMNLSPEAQEIPVNGVNLKNSIRCNSIPKMKCWENAKSQSFYARDNVSNFLKWCRKFGVRDAVIFESEDLVSHVNPRNVVLCLLEIARIACTKHAFMPAPGLVQFEQEIDEIENISETDGWSDSSLLQDIRSPLVYLTDTAPAPGVGVRAASASSLVSNSSSSGANSANSTNSTDSANSANSANSTNHSTPTILTSDLDHKVMLIAKSFYGHDARQGVQRLSEGKYRIANRIVFIRLLKARHVMVRVGGGWTTLSQFLERHGGDPTQEISPADLLPLDSRASSSSPRRRSSPLVNKNQSPSTPSLMRYVSSTPASRRSSLSSPEPWMSASSGYSSCSAGYNNSPPSTSTITAMMETPRRRRASTEAPCRRKAMVQRASIGGIVSHPTESYVNCSTTSTSNRPTSEPIKTRYPNYLQSSQHITNRNNSIVPLITMPSISMAKQSVFSKAVQKTC